MEQSRRVRDEWVDSGCGKRRNGKSTLRSGRDEGSERAVVTAANDR